MARRDSDNHKVPASPKSIPSAQAKTPAEFPLRSKEQEHKNPTPVVAAQRPSDHDRMRHPAEQQHAHQPVRQQEYKRPDPAPHYEHKPAPRQESKPAFVENYQLPQSYDNTQLTLMPRDPHWVHAYWDVAANTIDQIRKEYGGEINKSTFTLRLYDITAVDFNGENANRVIDVPVGADSKNWYLNMWCDNVTYCADLGFRTGPGGEFIPITRSNVVSTPRLGFSDRSDMIWLDVKGRRTGKPFVFLDRDSIAALLKKKQAGLADQKKVYRRKRLNLTEDDIRAYYSRLFPRLRRIMARRLRQGSYGLDRNRWKLYLKNGLLLEDLLFSGLSRDEFMRRVILGASEEKSLKSGASESITSRGGSSEREQKKRQFFFEIWTELLVYGRTEPDAHVWHGTKPVKLREDGTFTLRFALPEATTIPLDFLAQSNDKVDSRRIMTAADRTGTSYSK